LLRCAHFPDDSEPPGIYIHVPFCLGRCNYCAFISYPHDAEVEERYVRALSAEMRLKPTQSPVDTIYLGGGTPSVLEAWLIERILEDARSNYEVTEGAEITIEVNPGAGDAGQFVRLRKTGINRASLGIQSFNDAELSAMGRLHRANEAETAFRGLRRAGFSNISVDLIAGYPGQTTRSIVENLNAVFKLSPEHISVYLLEVKPGAKLHRDIRQGLIPEPDDDEQAEMYELMCRMIEEAGYEQYEISNFARLGYESKHNLKYWRDSRFIGLGAAAHGMTGRIRYSNNEDLGVYFKAIETGRPPVDQEAVLTAETRLKDALIMGARLVHGIDMIELGRRYKAPLREFILESVGDLASQGLFTIDDRFFRLTTRGRLLSNLVFSRWVD
jgi:oxygen-independent coproporphyrinogen-3 oxidase